MGRSRNAGRSPEEGLGAVREKQERTRDKRRLISDAAGKVISSHGIAGLTHRRVAQQAGVPLAATTYHFRDRAEIIRAASQMTLKAYDLSFSLALDRLREKGGSPEAFLAYFRRLIGNTAGRARARAICWGEIMLDAPRHPESLEETQDWFARLIGVWQDIMVACGMEDARQRAIFAIDILIGLLFQLVGLGLTETQVGKIMGGDNDVLEFRPAGTARDHDVQTVRSGAKSAATRARILAATIDILKSEGPGAVSSRTVAAWTGLTKAALFYYFPSVPDLLAAAQQHLFARSKDRYRQGLSEVGGSDVDFEQLIDRTAAVFLREATEFASECVANYSIWLRADGETAVRAMVWEVLADQHLAWHRALRRWSPDVCPVDPLLGQALFLGKLVRILATGSRIEDLAGIRREFSFGLKSIAAGSALAVSKAVQSVK